MPNEPIVTDDDTKDKALDAREQTGVSTDSLTAAENEQRVGHTPGPWTVLKGVVPGGGLAIGPELDGIGPHAIVTFNGGESEANARLIAAAPDMLAALKSLTTWLDDRRVEGDTIGSLQRQLADARRYITKAEGR